MTKKPSLKLIKFHFNQPLRRLFYNPRLFQRSNKEINLINHAVPNVINFATVTQESNGIRKKIPSRIYSHRASIWFCDRMGIVFGFVNFMS